MSAHDKSLKTAGVIIIGNEILTGKTRDSNSFYLASELYDLGVSLMRISVIPDDAGIIGSEAVLFSGNYDYVFTSGGIGPTHDDITMSAIAKGFGVELVTHTELERRFRERYGKDIGESVLCMARVPEGSELIEPGDGGFPVVCFRNLFIFPGIPFYMRKKFSLIKERFRTAAFYLGELFLNAEESDIAATLKSVEQEKGVTIGSYPVMDNPEYRIMVTIESKDRRKTDEAIDELLRILSPKIVVKTSRP